MTTNELREAAQRAAHILDVITDRCELGAYQTDAEDACGGLRAALTATTNEAAAQADGRELLREMVAQIDHLQDDLITAEVDEFGLQTYVPKQTLIFSNFVGAVLRWRGQARSAVATQPVQAQGARVGFCSAGPLSHEDQHAIWKESGTDSIDELPSHALAFKLGDYSRRLIERLSAPAVDRGLSEAEVCGRHVGSREQEQAYRAVCHENNKLRKENDRLRALATQPVQAQGESLEREPQPMNDTQLLFGSEALVDCLDTAHLERGDWRSMARVFAKAICTLRDHMWRHTISTAPVVDRGLSEEQEREAFDQQEIDYPPADLLIARLVIEHSAAIQNYFQECCFVGWQAHAALAASAPSQAEPECVVCTRCGHENWIQDGKAPCQVQKPEAPWRCPHCVAVGARPCPHSPEAWRDEVAREHEHLDAHAESNELYAMVDRIISDLESLRASTPDDASSIWEEKYGNLVDYVERVKTACLAPSQAGSCQASGYWAAVEVNPVFPALMEALDRAARKGYMPDAMTAEWEAFEYRLPFSGEVTTPPAGRTLTDAEERESDQQLMRFYSVETIDGLIDMMERHVARLQEKLAKHEKTFDFAPQRVREG